MIFASLIFLQASQRLWAYCYREEYVQVVARLATQQYFATNDYIHHTSLYWWLYVVFSSCNLIAASPLFMPRSEFVTLVFCKKSQDMWISSFIWFCCLRCLLKWWYAQNRYSDLHGHSIWQELWLKVRHHDFFRQLSKSVYAFLRLEAVNLPFGGRYPMEEHHHPGMQMTSNPIQSVQIRYQMLYHIFENFMAGTNLTFQLKIAILHQSTQFQRCFVHLTDWVSLFHIARRLLPLTSPASWRRCFQPMKWYYPLIILWHDGRVLSSLEHFYSEWVAIICYESQHFGGVHCWLTRERP